MVISPHIMGEREIKIVIIIIIRETGWAKINQTDDTMNRKLSSGIILK